MVADNFLVRDTLHLTTNATTSCTFGDASRGDNVLTMNSGAFCEGISVLADVTNDSKWSEASVTLFAVRFQFVIDNE
jgi:hypothetical protein